VTRKLPNAAPATVEAPQPLTSQPSQDTMIDTHIGHTPLEQPPNPAPPPTYLQQTLPHNNTNAPSGDAVQYQKPHGYFRILSKNISTLNSQNLDMLAIATKLQQCNTSIFLTQETSIPWTPQNLSTVQSQCQQVHHHQMQLPPISRTYVHPP